jgi:hypothetical protein
MDHHLCKNAGNAPWEKPRVQGGSYRPHYRKDEADSYINAIKRNYGAALERERIWLEVIDDLMQAIASTSAQNISQAYNRAAMKIAATHRKPSGDPQDAGEER